ncbi:MAG: ESPR domain-containing protein, partial [Burkholderiaceae bacterium]|nr:ESPR domain-containing protein [Burkholderiaceae bacterium]
MNKIFKIVFNAARGKMMVVNEATSSVQTGKKAAVTVAVIGALAAGSAMAAESVSGVWLVTDQAVKTFNATSGVPTGVQRVTTTLITEKTVFDN